MKPQLMTYFRVWKGVDAVVYCLELRYGVRSRLVDGGASGVGLCARMVELCIVD